ADVCLALDTNPRFTLADVVAGTRQIEDVVVDGPPNVQRVPGGSVLREIASLSNVQRQRLLDGLRRLAANVDDVLVDSAIGIAADVSWFAPASREVLVVTTPDPEAMRDA